MLGLVFVFGSTACSAIMVKDPSKNSALEADLQPTEAGKARGGAVLVTSGRSAS